jgi:hypothetical protein
VGGWLILFVVPFTFGTIFSYLKKVDNPNIKVRKGRITSSIRTLANKACGFVAGSLLLSLLIISWTLSAKILSVSFCTIINIKCTFESCNKDTCRVIQNHIHGRQQVNIL